VDEAGAFREHPVELLHRQVGVEQREERHADDAAVGAKAPVLGQPPVERFEVGVGHLGREVGVKVLFHADAHRRQHDGGLDALLIHDRQAGLAGEELRVILGVDGGVGDVAALDLSPEERLEMPGRPDMVAGRDAHEVGLVVADEDSSVGIVGRADDAHGLVPEPGRDVAGEAVIRLVVVVVGVGEPVTQHGHRVHLTHVHSSCLASGRRLRRGRGPTCRW
jgi:hypothetical protein